MYSFREQTREIDCIRYELWQYEQPNVHKFNKEYWQNLFLSFQTYMQSETVGVNKPWGTCKTAVVNPATLSPSRSSRHLYFGSQDKIGTSWSNNCLKFFLQCFFFKSRISIFIFVLQFEEDSTCRKKYSSQVFNYYHISCNLGVIG